MLPKRARKIKPFIVMEVLERAKELEAMGKNIIHLEVGEPDFDVPEPIKKAADQAMKTGHTHYTHSLGDQNLRKRISAKYHEKYDVDIDPERVIITLGSSPGIYLTLSVLAERGQEVIMPDPGYACYANFIKLIEAVPVPVGCMEKDNFQYDVGNVKKVVNDKTRAIFLNSPSNPTGYLTPPETMQELSGIGPWIISDEIYHGLVYDKKEHSILEYTDKAFVINGFSKLYAMTGLRIGYMIVPKEFIRPIQKIQQSLFICPNSVSQQAAIEALNCREDTEKMKSEYRKRRDLMVRMLRDIGFGISDAPDGAFYVFVNAGKFSDDSYKLAFDILEHAGVGVTPGIDFGKQGEGYLRFSYANSLENIEKGLERIGAYLQKYHQK